MAITWAEITIAGIISGILESLIRSRAGARFYRAEILKKRQNVSNSHEGQHYNPVPRSKIKTSRSLRAIADFLARFPGRKNLVWVTNGFPLVTGSDAFAPTLGMAPTGGNFFRETEKISRALSSADIIVYPVDSRGLWGTTQSAAVGRGGGRVFWRNVGGRPKFRDMASGVESMSVLADETGGRAFRNRNDIGHAIRTAIYSSNAFGMGTRRSSSPCWINVGLLACRMSVIGEVFA